MDGRVFLKIKIKSLAGEASIIKKEEKKRRRFRNRLYEHRINVVRKECRHAHLAYGFLRERNYKQIENKCHEKPNWDRVKKLLERYAAIWDADNESYTDYQSRLSSQMKKFEIWKKE